MKHLVRDSQLEGKLGTPEGLRIYSCQYNDGKMSSRSGGDGEIVRLGEDGMAVWFFPCISCRQQLESFVLRPIITEAMKSSKTLDSLVEGREVPFDFTPMEIPSG